MTSWTPEQLGAIGTADELDIAAFRPDGTLRPYTTIWVVRVDDGLYARSYGGQDGTWYQAVQRRQEGRIRAGGVERDVTFEHPTGADEDAIDAVYRSKYGRYGRSYLDPMLAPGARATTLRLNPASPTTEGHR
jgi:hypothetical protein